MSSLQSLRHAQLLTRFVLVWFALFIGVAVASPLVKPEAVQLVCTAIGGVKLVALDSTGDATAEPAAHHALDCPACLPLNVPPVVEVLATASPDNLSHVLQRLPAARLASLLGQPWQARAPPLFLA